MFTLIAENEKGEQIQLTQNPNYSVLSVEGFTPPDAVIATTEIGTMDGEQFNYSKLGKRNIVITLLPETPIEKNRIVLYKWFTPKKPIRMYYRNGSRNVYADGYVEGMAGSLHDNPQKFQISILCTDSYLRDSKSVLATADYTESLFEFPFSIGEEGMDLSAYDRYQSFVITNESDLNVGAMIKISAFGDVVKPKIYRRDTLENMELDISLKSGDMLELCTVKGKKGVWLVRGSDRENVINFINENITWMQLEPGDNIFTYDAEAGLEFMQVTFEYNNVYGGV